MIKLIEPKLEEYGYEQKLMSDPQTMDYNAGYDMDFEGYHKDTGCIDFPKEKWEAKYLKRKHKDVYYAYIQDVDRQCYVGYVNYQYSDDEKRYNCGVVIEGKYRGQGYGKQALQLLCKHAKEGGIDALYDNFEVSRSNTVHLFLSVGFEIVEHQTWKKNGQDEDGIIVRKIL